MPKHIRLHWIFNRFMAPESGGEGGSGGGAVDRGDDFSPSGDDTVAAGADAVSAGAGDDTVAAGDDVDPDADPDPDKVDDRAEDKKGDKKREPRIPLSRHKELLEKARAERDALAERLSSYQRGTEVAQINEDISKHENDIIKLEKEYTVLLADGDADKAALKMAEIRALDRKVAEAKGDMKIAAAEARATERMRYETTLERIESAFPQLNPDHDSYDKELMGEVVELKSAYEARGLTPTAAMQKAVKLLVKPETTRQTDAIETTPRVKEKDVAAERKKDAVAKTVDAVKKQPPSTTKVGLNSNELGGSLTAQDVIKLSQDEFKKLPEEALSKLRGDEL